MIRISEHVVEFIGTVRRRKDVHLFAGHFLKPEPRFVQAARFCSGKERGKHRIQIEIGKRFLCQQDFRPGATGDPGEDLPIFDELIFIDHIAGGGEGGESVLR